jgi:Mrp family chromosome partitioning ATPase
MRILIKDVTRRFPRERFTIFDAPPIDQVADVELLNEYVDLVLVCIPYGKVSQAQIKKGLAKLDSKKLMGTVLCGAPRMKNLSTNLAK